MAKKRPKVNLTQPIQPQTGDLERLFVTEQDTEQASGLQLMAVRVDAIAPDPGQPRRTFPEDSLQDLSESIQQEGVIQPIEVTQMGPDQFMIVHGERRWRAALLAGLETIPAVVRRRDYDTITRLVRQLVENIQREDLNDIDRASGLLRLRDLMQEELSVKVAEGNRSTGDSPWSKTITWAKVGKRLGYSRQRIHQLIRLLDLPNEIKDAVREGKLSERDARVYQGLQARQQRELHRARFREELTAPELRRIALQLREEPGKTVSQAVQEARHPPRPIHDEPAFETSIEPTTRESEEAPPRPLRSQPWTEGTIVPPRQTRPTSIDRLDWIRGHLARIQRHGLTPVERREIVRLLDLIRQDVASLRVALRQEEGAGRDDEEG